MKNFVRRLLFSCVVLCGAPVPAQQWAEERRQYLDPATAVSDDPRRVPVAPVSTGPLGALVLRDGLVFDGTGAPTRAATLVIEGNRIKRVLAPSQTDWPEAARIIDVTGMLVMPGLIDGHMHLSYPNASSSREVAKSGADAALRGMERLLVYIQSGITAVRDTGSQSDVPFTLKRWVRDRRIPGPRIFSAGQLITGTGGHGAEDAYLTSIGNIREASGPDDWREAVREQFKAGADFIKLASHFSVAEIRAAVEEAHTLGMRVTVDAETFYIQWAVEAGADSIEHPLPRSDAAIRLMARNGTAAIPTLVPYMYMFDKHGGYFGSTSRRFTMTQASNIEMLRRLKRAGVTIGVGTDVVPDGHRYLPLSYIRELKLYEEAGFTPAEALIAATRINAQILDMGEKLGTLEQGKLADVSVIAGRPDLRLEDLMQVRHVIRDGEIVVEDGRVVFPKHVPEPEPTRRGSMSAGTAEQ